MSSFLGQNGKNKENFNFPLSFWEFNYSVVCQKQRIQLQKHYYNNNKYFSFLMKCLSQFSWNAKLNSLFQLFLQFKPHKSPSPPPQISGNFHYLTKKFNLFSSSSSFSSRNLQKPAFSLPENFFQLFKDLIFFRIWVLKLIKRRANPFLFIPLL